ncbi:WD40 repeat domain-containing protein [Planktothrix agardhii]|uniref:WD40 repeat domain-containing protein n=1 Tax=Planktothrix agardhii TaxID=1160 RepID=UPI002B1EF63D|nr:WD40 repeat domain-containing protein [Planktothrix agardhii]MEA5562178.1 WD40 repeat domain-containing protein [Planktothrix agardhii UHCC 0887]
MNQDLQKIKSQLDQGTEQEKLLALSKALNYGEEGLELFINYSLKATDRIKQSAYWILHGYNPYLANNTSNKNINPADTITCLAVSPDNKLLIGGSWKKLWIWYLNTGEICHSYEAHDSWILSVAISSDGKKIVSASADKTIKIWNLSPWRLDHTLKEHTSWVNAVTITPDNETIVSGSADKTIKLWNLQTGKLCKTLKNEQELGIVLSLKLDSTGNFLFCGSANNNITIWNLKGNTLVQKLEGHLDWVQSLTPIPTENSLLSGSRDGTIKYWKPENKSNNNQKNNFKELWLVLLLAGLLDIGSTELFGFLGFQVKWYWMVLNFIVIFVIIKSIDLAFYSPEIIFKDLTLYKSQLFYNKRINSLELSQEEKEYIIIGADDSIIKKYYLTNQKIEDFLKDDFHFISSLVISSDKKYIVTASEDWVTVWDLNTREFLHHMKGCSYPKLSKLTINPDKGQEIYFGQTRQFKVIQFDQDDSEIFLHPKNITWECSKNSSVGNIQQNGLFTAGKIEGNIQIIARIGKFKASVPIVVIEPPKVTRLQIEPSSAELQFNKPQPFRCKVFDQRHQVMLNQAISWKVSSPNAGTVDKNGEFKAGKKAGKFEIIASAGGKEERVTIYVIKLDKLKFTKSVSELKFKECFQFEVKGIDQYGDDIKLEKITWEISPEFAGKIDQYGYFTAGEQEGIVKIIASAKGIKESLNISIIESSKLYKLEFIKLVSELKFEESFQFELKGIDQYGDDIKVEKVTWKVKPEFAGIIDRTSGYFIADKQKLDTVQIIASAQGIEESVTISILEPSILAGIRIEPSSVTLKPEEKQTFFVIGVDQYNNDFPINNPKWSATDGYINGFGLVADYRAGVDQIGNSEVTVTVGKYTAKASIHVPSILKRIEISPKEKELKPDEEYTFSVTGFNQVNQNIPIDRVKWSSTAGGTINNQGVFIGGYKKREVTITVEVGNVNDTAQVILLPVLRKLKINPSFVYLELIGKQQFIVKGLDQFGNNIDPGEIEWTTTGCKIDQNGLFSVTSNAQGYFQVTATSKLTPKYTKNMRMFLLDVGVSSLVLSWLISLTPVLEDLFALNSDENAYLEETLEDDDQSDIDLLPSIEENTNDVVLEESLDEQLDENQDINSSLLAQELDIQINEERLALIKDEESPIIDFDVALENWLFNKLLKLIARCLRFIGRWCINEATSSLSATADVFVLAVQYNPYRHFRCINTLRFDSEREHPTTAFVITPNGEKLISSHCLDSVKIWDLKTGNLLDTLEADYSVLCITITNDGNYVIASGWNNTIKMWDLTTRQLIKSFEGDHDLVGLVAISPDTNKLISGEVNNIKIWDLNIGGLLKSMEINLSPNLNSVWNYSYWWYKCNLIIPNSLTLISANHIIKKYDLETGKLLAILGIILNNTSALAITPSSDKIISNDGNKINIWSVETKISKPLLSLNSNIPHIYALAITPDGQKLVSGGGDQLYGTSSEFIIEIWDINTGDLLHSIHDYLASVHALAVTPDGTKIISGHGDGTIKVWGIPELSDV